MENKILLKFFKDLIVWQKAVDLATLVYTFTANFPHSELYGITNQIRRSVVSISSNIAEGFKRRHGKEKLQFYNVAYGSVAELESQIEVSYKLNFLNNEDYQILTASVVKIEKMIDGLIKSLNKKLPKPYILQVIFFLVFLYSISHILYPSLVQAAQFNFISPTQTIGVGQQFQIDLILNTENEFINAVEGKLVFPIDLLELKEIRDGNSIVNFWIEKPKIESSGQITFSGIIPGGYSNVKGFIFSAVFEIKKEGAGVIEIQEDKVLLNDGEGTQTKLLVKNFSFVAIRTHIRDDSWVSPEDTEPPEEFTPQIAADPTIFKGKWFLVFATQDKGSGIDYYEVQEGNDLFSKAQSPYLLRYQKLNKPIVVKAVDRQGNERIVKLIAPHGGGWDDKIWYFVIIIGVILIWLLISRNQWFKQLWRKLS
ncbi:MAG: four helix bundle protein [Patescibacteria group bacterium]